MPTSQLLHDLFHKDLSGVSRAFADRDSVFLDNLFLRKLSIHQQHLVLSEAIEHENNEFLRRAVCVYNTAHKNNHALIVAVKVRNFEATTILAPVSHPHVRQHALEACIGVDADYVQAILPHTQGDQSAACGLAGYMGDRESFDLLWPHASADTVAHTDKVLRMLAQRNWEDALTTLLPHANLACAHQALLGAISHNHTHLANLLLEHCDPLHNTSYALAFAAHSSSAYFDILLPLSNPMDALKHMGGFLNDPVCTHMRDRLQEHCTAIKQHTLLQQHITSAQPTVKRKM